MTVEFKFKQHLAYQSVSELVEDCDRVRRAGCCLSDYNFTASRFVGRDFSGWEDVKEAAVQTWEEGMATAKRLLEELHRHDMQLPTPKDRRRRRVYSEDDGDEINNDRLRGGRPYWEATVRKQAQAPQHLHIITDLGGLSHRGSDEITWRGIAAVVLCDLLESTGYRVQLTGLWSNRSAYNSRSSSELTGTSVVLKAYDTPVDTAAVVNAVSGWFYRTVLFQSVYIRPATPSGGLGATAHINANDPFVKELADGSPVVIVADVWDLKSALALVRRVIEQLNEGTLSPA